MADHDAKALAVVKQYDLQGHYEIGGCGDTCECNRGVCELAVAAIASALREAEEMERREIMNLLGMDENGNGLVTVEDWDGTPARFDHDPYYELEGALIDLRRQGADKVCISTIEKVQAQLAAVSKRAAAIRSTTDE